MNKTILGIFVAFLLLGIATSTHAAPTTPYNSTRVNLTGLDNALVQVHNENARAHILINLQRWMDKHGNNMYQNVTAYDINETATEIDASKPHHVLIFTFKGTDRYIANDGAIISVQQSIIGRLLGEKIQSR